MKVTSLIGAKEIQVVDNVANWKEAVQLASKPLLDEHTITEIC